MVRKFLMPLMAVILVMAIAIPGCEPADVDPVEPPDPPPATGAMIGEIIISEEKSPASTVAKMILGDADLHAQPGISDPDIYDAIVVSDLPHFFSYGSYREYRYNPAGPLFGPEDKFNPFHFPEVREAMNYLIDREEIVGEILGGLGEPITALGAKQFPESQERYPHIIDAIETKYAYEEGKGEAELTAALEAIAGVEFNDVSGYWEYEGDPIEVHILNRSDLAPFPEAGYYLETLLIDFGFVVTIADGTSLDHVFTWLLGDPTAGEWNIYTGGWGIPTIPRDQATTPAGMQTQFWYPVPLFAYYETQIDDWDPSYRVTIDTLRDRDFADLIEREALFSDALYGMMEFAAMTYICDMAAVSPWTYNMNLIMNLAYGAGEGWTRAIHFDFEGDPIWAEEANVEMDSLMVNPWNPVDGSNWVYDLTIKRDAVTESGLLQHPITGLYSPNRIATAEVTIGDNRPVTFAEGQPDWITDFTVLSEGDLIEVPETAWADWDADAEEWITAGERFAAENRTALRKSVVTYPADIFDFPMHDGSTLSLADFVTSFLVGSFAQAKVESPIYDPDRVAAHDGFMATFKGMEIESVDPLKIAYYSDFWALDPEWNVASFFPAWKQGGSNPWHMIAIGWLADAAGELAFGSAKATAGEVEWMDYTKGPSLDILEAQMDIIIADPTQAPYFQFFTDLYGDWELGSFADEVEERMTNLEFWYEDQEHFWVDMGLYYVADVFPLEKTVVLKRFEDHPDPFDKWIDWVGLEP